MKLNQIFSGNFLKAEDLAGRTVNLQISQAEVKEFDDGKKVVLHFLKTDKQLVCNKTNCSIIAENLGTDDTDLWVNGKIALCVKKVEFQGKLVPAIRVVLNDPAVASLQPAHGILGKPAVRPPAALPAAAVVPEPDPVAGPEDPNDPDFVPF